MSGTVAWVYGWLDDETPEDPSPPGTYRRWGRMCVAAPIDAGRLATQNRVWRDRLEVVSGSSAAVAAVAVLCWAWAAMAGVPDWHPALLVAAASCAALFLLGVAVVGFIVGLLVVEEHNDFSGRWLFRAGKLTPSVLASMPFAEDWLAGRLDARTRVIYDKLAPDWVGSAGELVDTARYLDAA